MNNDLAVKLHELSPYYIENETRQIDIRWNHGLCLFKYFSEVSWMCNICFCYLRITFCCTGSKQFLYSAVWTRTERFSWQIKPRTYSRYSLRWIHIDNLLHDLCIFSKLGETLFCLPCSPASQFFEQYMSSQLLIVFFHLQNNLSAYMSACSSEMFVCQHLNFIRILIREEYALF